ncbi:MAG: thioredoxin family protein [Rikenella sp.]|nr:thioredoxin family protein [Rikenella sp.]
MAAAVGQPIKNPVHWTFAASGEQVEMSATIDGDWHMYDIGPYDGGPNATTFTFELPAGVTLDGGVQQLDRPTRVQDEIFGMEIGYFAKSARFVQKFKISPRLATAGEPIVIKGSVEWQACDEESCLPPTDEDFTVTITPAKTVATTASAPAAELPAELNQPAAPDPEGTMVRDEAIFVTPADTTAATTPTEADSSAVGETSFEGLQQNENKSFWTIIIEAILWGFAALLTPCVFPMVPMTVSFFMKGSDNKAKGRFMASFYGLSIVALYTLPIAAIILITYLVGGDSVTADIFNWLATHWVPNILFFLIFMIFAASFFGAFEITMPSKLVNKSDSKADKGGLVGVFFMALTLVLVSFSCTGPIVGTVLVKSTQGAIWEPIFTMLAFSAAFALPFTIFAFFPALLKNLPKSGGWLNSVKVVLGFIELALGLKFLSVADQTYHWGILDREVYVALWVVIFALLGFYLLGKIRFAHDSEVKHVSVKRLFLSIITFAFVIYLIPGMFGAPLKALSGYLPPLSTMDFNLAASAGGGVPASGGAGVSTLDRSKIEGGAPKYSDFLHLPHGLEGFFDYRQGMEYAAAVGKPVFLDFTGHGCVNCREMEANVWSDPTVQRILRDNYVIVALYVDDKKQLPESEWVTTPDGKVRKTLGKINASFQIERFGINAQPYYVLLNNEGQPLVTPRSYDLDVNGFINFLESGLEAYKAQR